MDPTAQDKRSAKFLRLPFRPGAWAMVGGLVVCMLVALAFGPAVKGPFFFDDEHFVVRNTAIQSLGHIAEIYRTTVTQSAHIVGNFYRPNQQIVYSLLYQIWGTSVSWPYHLVPILLHTANAGLIALWLAVLGYGWAAVLTAVIFFAVHPVQTEAVAYISGLADPLALFFMLLGLVGYTRGLMTSGMPKDGPRAGSTFALILWPMMTGILALTSKENAVVLLPLLILTSLYWMITTQKPLPKKAAFGITAIGLMTGTYLGLKFTVLNFTNTIGLTDDINAYTQDLGLRLTTFLHILWDYAVLIVAPIDLFYEKPYTAYPGFSHPRAWFGIGLLCVSMMVIFRARKAPRLALGLAIVWAALLPYAGVIPVNAMYLEHWLYVPMVGLTMIAASLITWLEKRLAARSQARFGVLVTGLILVAAMVYRTSNRAADWADPERFYLGEIAHGSVAARTYNNLGLYYADQKQPDKAAKYWQLAADSALSRPYPQPYHNLARYYLERGQLQEGLRQLHLALKADKSFVYSLALLGDIFAKLGEGDKTVAIQTALDKSLRGETYDFSALEALLFPAEGTSVH